MEHDNALVDSKIPFLGDIPLLGNLFKHKQSGHTKTELMIFITPHVVRMPSQLAAISGAESSKGDLPTQAFDEKELNQFLEGVPLKKKPPVTGKGKSKSED